MENLLEELEPRTREATPHRVGVSVGQEVFRRGYQIQCWLAGCKTLGFQVFESRSNQTHSFEKGGGGMEGEHPPSKEEDFQIRGTEVVDGMVEETRTRL